ncbi:hypothetical protein ZIOFF_055984 [Zingiber officinale]|uniref:Methyltransferase n=1 Tax=Zingiber officinale TaxID=94328 RepID=A0A8J5KKR5_ZINOF|nr:hypothetical protein ZIOFF_055984 [Zingiber officinale]
MRYGTKVTSRPLYRWVSGGGNSSGSAGHDPFDMSFRGKVLGEKGFSHESLSTLRCWQSLIFAFLNNIYHHYRRLQEQVVSDLTQIGKLSLGIARLKELEFCPPQYESYVPCNNNVSQNLDSVDPVHLEHFTNKLCVGRMMVEKEQISFQSGSIMVDGVEDYTHQIAEMIGLQESNFLAGGLKSIDFWLDRLFVVEAMMLNLHITNRLHPEALTEDAANWNSVIHNYWSLVSPLIFSDHPKRTGDEEPSPPFNMLFGMCQAFPTYPRTYYMVHAEGLMTHVARQKHRCSTLEMLLEIDRILRSEACVLFSPFYLLFRWKILKLLIRFSQGWMIIRVTRHFVEAARSMATQLRRDARLMELDSGNNKKILSFRKQ